MRDFVEGKKRGWLILGLLLVLVPARAIEDYNPISNTATPESTDSTGIDGAAYVGQVGGASGVYLGDGFVLTAAHVPVGTFTLNHLTYDVVPNSTEQVSAGVDLVLFQIDTTPALPQTALTLASSAPAPGDTVQLIGYGVISGSQVENFATDTITSVYSGTPTMVSGGSTTYSSDDFQTLDYPGNNGQIIGGDSGGGDFDTTNGLLLIGINEAEEINTENNHPVGSDYVEISEYSSQIESLMAAAAPEPPEWLMLGLGLMVAAFCSRRLRTSAQR